MQETDVPNLTISGAIRDVVTGETPRASAFIVTIYGDAVEPRGGTLWMGTLIDCCAEHGISESLVRTAVSRLVGAGRLVGERIGRRSYYRLSDAAQAEFRAAARVLFAPPPEPRNWLVAFSGETGDAALPEGWARAAANVAIAPNRSDIRQPDAIVMACDTISGEGAVPALAARLWPVEDVASAYRAFLRKYERLAAELTDPRALPLQLALALRLRLVHDYRHAALSDPRLPREAWPPGWSAGEARRLFVGTYLSLSDAADGYVGRSFHDANGLLPSKTPATETRLDRLRREARC
ncbi:PaaX family transcriptional regulator C-terminal domain-containing protein [Ostreiculturibacter nitratireducens]|uniref:PaaX family transcriptional regulator C-terminal domain-containing protein n=1 Tax=Ostreiculturibacter nitratireducens TaxID=3075226 RepID=UPI0031B5B072